MTPVSEATLTSLRDAIARLLSNRPIHTDGRLTGANLAREAGVSRATANRAETVLKEFHAARGDRAHAPVAKSPKARIKELEAEVTLLRGQERREVCQLRQAVQIMAQQVQVLAPPQRHGRVTALKLSMKQIRPLAETWCRSIRYLDHSIARSSGSRAQCLARRSNSM